MRIRRSLLKLFFLLCGFTATAGTVYWMGSAGAAEGFHMTPAQVSPTPIPGTGVARFDCRLFNNTKVECSVLTSVCGEDATLQLCSNHLEVFCGNGWRMNDQNATVTNIPGSISIRGSNLVEGTAAFLEIHLGNTSEFRSSLLFKSQRMKGAEKLMGRCSVVDIR